MEVDRAIRVRSAAVRAGAVRARVVREVHRVWAEAVGEAVAAGAAAAAEGEGERAAIGRKHEINCDWQGVIRRSYHSDIVRRVGGWPGAAERQRVERRCRNGI